MAILAVGVDIIETARFREQRRSKRFLQSIFTPDEHAYCITGKSHPEQHFAVRYAAKEAACKALMSAGFGFVSVAQVEVTRSAKTGAPRIALHPGRKGEAPPLLPPGTRLHVSLSHTQHYAAATVIVEHE